MREYGVEKCSEECGVFVASKPSIHHMWTVAVTGKLVAMQGDDPSFCPHCNTKFGIDERGPWREAMVPRAALEWLAKRVVDVELVGTPYAEHDGSAPAAICIEAALAAAEEATPDADATR